MAISICFGQVGVKSPSNEKKNQVVCGGGATKESSQISRLRHFAENVINFSPTVSCEH